jgi:hypothetical protein
MLLVSTRLFDPEFVTLPLLLNVSALLPLIVVLPPNTMAFEIERAPPPA